MKTISTIILLLLTTTLMSQNSSKEWPNYKNSLNIKSTLNLLDVEIAPVYKGCEDKESNLEKINCLNTNLSIYTNDKINELVNTNKIKIKKGINKLRVFFFVDENGTIIVKQVTGNFSLEVKKEIAGIIKKAPKLIPAKNNNNNTTVKYSIKIPFLIK